MTTNQSIVVSRAEACDSLLLLLLLPSLLADNAHQWNRFTSIGCTNYERRRTRCFWWDSFSLSQLPCFESLFGFCVYIQKTSRHQGIPRILYAVKLDIPLFSWGRQTSAWSMILIVRLLAEIGLHFYCCGRVRGCNSVRTVQKACDRLETGSRHSMQIITWGI